jgi:MSHA biogenesis protein MshQ
MKMIKMINMFSLENMRDRSSMVAVVVLVVSLMVALFAAPSQAVIVYTGSSSGANNALPTDMTAGPLTINIPAGTVAGQALIASIAARPSGMTVTVPPGWFPMTVTDQPAGGVSTLPGGMTLLTYYHIVGISEPASYTWTFANTAGSGANYGGSAVGGLLAFSGIDTSGGNPINVWSALLNANAMATGITTTPITPTLTNTMIVSSLSYLSGDSFNPPTLGGVAGVLTVRLDQRAPAPPAPINAVGTTLQMSTAPWATATSTGAARATAVSNDDTGVGHLMALKPSLIDPAIAMTRSGPLLPGSSASYTLTVTNNGINSEPGPISVVDTLPAGLTYNPVGSGGAGWVCGVVAQVVTCTRAGALAGGASAAALVLNVNVGAGASGTLTNTATVSGTGGDGNTANNTATDSYTISRDLTLALARVGTLDPGQNATYTLDVSNLGTLAEAGPITITDTLPAGLTYVSGVGAGWVCGAAGQTVTCTRAGSLAGGAAAATLTLTVAVSSTAFSVTHTATVAGTGVDSNPANNTASDTYNVAADLSLTKTRGAALVPGTNATYTLNVTNAGPNVSPQPITITDTLPAGLTYVSGVGTNWSCSAAGQVVTCTRNVTLANGASSSVVLTVAVAAGASGTITNSATVSGTATDSTPANNTATDSYTIPLSTYAYYKMDEANWTGAANEVLDSSGTNHASRIGGATVTTVAAPASGLKGDTCRAGTIPLGTGAATQMGVNTPINPNTLGNAGTVSFWYKNNVAWTTAGNTNDRTLLDATGATNAGEFWLVLRQTGDLRFMLDNAGGTAQTITGSVRAFGANTWHHIAITWDFSAAVHTMTTYVDGVLDATRNNVAVTSATSNYGTFFVGDSKTTVYTNPNRGNSANGVIDEVRVYTSALTAAQITTDMNATHSCVSVDHYELSLPTSSITCLPITATVTACTDNSNPCTNPYAAASGTTANLATTGGTLGATTVTFNASGVASTTLSYPAAADGAAASVTLSGEQTVAANPRKCCPDGVSCVVANSCSTTFNTAGFIFASAANGTAATIPSQVAGVSSSTYYLRAVKTSTTTKACESALVGANTVNFAYECNNPTTCSGSNLMSVNGGSATTIARNNNGSVSSYSSVNMTFDANGNAPFTFNYSDVGQVKLYASKAAGGSLLSALTGSSNAFVVKPHHFVLSNPVRTSDSFANPGAADQNGARFIGAGENFTVTATAMDALNIATPNYGKETAPESVRLTSTLVAPVGGANPAIGYTTGFGAFTNGAATGTDFKWSEVGIITLTPGVGDSNYLGAGDVTGTASGNVGRFSPAYFDVTRIHGCPVGADPLLFTYSGQPFTVTATARNAAGVTTSNYRDFGGGIVFSKNTTISDAGTTVNFAPNNNTPSNNLMSAGNFVNGVRIQGTVTYAFPAKETAPATITLRATDTDGVNSSGHTEEQTEIRSGRVHIFNAYGSELVNLPVPMRVEYYSATDGWITNTIDTCTSVALGNLIPSNPMPVVGSSPAKTTNASIANAPFVAGDAGLLLSKPDVGGTGYVDLTADLTANVWLKYDWNGTGTAVNPTGRATFGIYRGSPKHIYLRER